MSWQSLFARYPEILQAYTACRLTIYDASPCYLIPRSMKSDSFVWHDHGTHITCGAEGSAPIVIPVTLNSPKEYMEAVLDTIHRYGGAYSLPTAYATPLGKMGYKLIKRPWGNLDFVMETDVLANLPGKRHERKRTTLNRLVREGYTVRPMTSADAGEVERVENLWEEAHRGRTGRHGYASLLARGLDEYPDHFRMKGLICHAPDGEVVGVSLSGQMTADTWSCSYRYADNNHAGVSLLLFREMARLYSDLPYEADGSGGAPGSSLFEFKRRLVDNHKLMLELWVVMK